MDQNIIALKIASTSAGDIAVKCAEPEGWSISATMEPATESDVTESLHLELTAPSARKPPKFEVTFAVPLDGACHRWTWNSESALLPPDWWSGFDTDIAHGVPICAFVRGDDSNRITVACSEAARVLHCEAGVNEETACLVFKFAFFTSNEAPIDSYRADILIDTLRRHFSESVGKAAEWIDGKNGIKPPAPPASAFEPLYSSWYCFHQDVSDTAIEAECAEAAGDGMKVLIVDDGWQTDDNSRSYAYCGDWQVSKRRFPDMRAHVARVHALGLKYMVWFAVPFIGWKSENHARFAGKFLYDRARNQTSVLDPRYPEVRKFLADTYARAVRDWDIDGLKLDFIDSFAIVGEDPAAKNGFAGCDFTSLPDAVKALFDDIRRALDAVKPSLLIEFRQAYIGPAIRSFGNMLRATDCPASIHANRARIANLRLTSGKTAVHADMLEWHPAESVESAALQVLSCLFGVIQYSMRLGKLPMEHRAMVRHWIRFTTEHRNALLHGGFLPHFPMSGYGVIEAWDDSERIMAAYAPDVICTVADSSRTVYIVNATPRQSVAMRLPAAPGAIEVFDTMGRAAPAPSAMPGPGLVEIAVPPSGYAVIRW